MELITHEKNPPQIDINFSSHMALWYIQNVKVINLLIEREILAYEMSVYIIHKKEPSSV